MILQTLIMERFLVAQDCDVTAVSQIESVCACEEVLKIMSRYDEALVSVVPSQYGRDHIDLGAQHQEGHGVAARFLQAAWERRHQPTRELLDTTKKKCGSLFGSGRKGWWAAAGVLIECNAHRWPWLLALQATGCVCVVRGCGAPACVRPEIMHQCPRANRLLTLQMSLWFLAVAGPSPFSDAINPTPRLRPPPVPAREGQAMYVYYRVQPRDKREGNRKGAGIGRQSGREKVPFVQFRGCGGVPSLVLGNMLTQGVRMRTRHFI